MASIGGRRCVETIRVSKERNAEVRWEVRRDDLVNWV